MKRLSTYLGNKYLWILLIIFFIFFKLGDNYFSLTVRSFTDSRINNYAQEIITKSIEEEVLDKLSADDYFIEHYDNNGKVSYAYLNTIKINQIRNKTSEHILVALDEINNHTDFNYIEIPLGYFLGSQMFFANGIRVPVNIDVVGSQNVDISSSIVTQGINSTVIEIYLEITISVRVVIPFQTQMVDTITKIPLSLQIMNNEIPYYLGDLLD